MPRMQGAVKSLLVARILHQVWPSQGRPLAQEGSSSVLTADAQLPLALEQITTQLFQKDVQNIV